MNVLIGVCVIQSLLLGLVILALTLNQLMPSYPTLILALAVLGFLGYVFRRQIPGWFGQMSRMFFARMLSTKSDSVNDR
ncbi:MAG: hypothetical protein AAFN77_05435 [Planctomycetota bacterium]